MEAPLPIPIRPLLFRSFLERFIESSRNDGSVEGKKHKQWVKWCRLINCYGAYNRNIIARLAGRMGKLEDPSESIRMQNVLNAPLNTNCIEWVGVDNRVHSYKIGRIETMNSGSNSSRTKNNTRRTVLRRAHTWEKKNVNTHKHMNGCECLRSPESNKSPSTHTPHTHSNILAHTRFVAINFQQ